MAAGARFPRFSFSILEVDVELARGKILEFHETFRECPEEAS